MIYWHYTPYIDHKNDLYKLGFRYLIYTRINTVQKQNDYQIHSPERFSSR